MKMRRMRDNLSLIALGCLIITLFFAVVIKQYNLNANATNESMLQEEPTDGKHFISFFDGESRINTRSDAATVRDALIRADINLSEGDKVEPALDEPISSDDFNINIYRAQDRVVVDGVHCVRTRTAATDPEEIVASAGIELLEADRVEVRQSGNFLEGGNMTTYQVVRAKTVHLAFYGEDISIRTQASTVGEFLAEREIDTNPEKNWISLSSDSKITDGLSFSIQQQGIRTITVEESVPFSENVTIDYDLDYGKREITQYGQEGKKTVTYEVDMHDGVELSRTKISEIITKAAVNQEVRQGMKINLPAGSHEDWMAAAGISASDYGYVNYIIEHESHWNPLSVNTRSGATGLCQALPGSKMASAGSDWATNPVTQLRWCTGYAVGRYGSWQAAYNFWLSRHWW